MYKYPYGDSQQLNLDWILAKLKELEESGVGLDLEEVSNALISLTYNTNTAYRRYDYAFLNGKLYRCLTDTTGAFDPAAWMEVRIGEDIPVLTRLLNAVDASLTTLQNRAVIQVQDKTADNNTLDNIVNHALAQITAGMTSYGKLFTFKTNNGSGNDPNEYFGNSRVYVICNFQQYEYGCGLLLSDNPNNIAAFIRRNNINTLYPIGDFQSKISNLNSALKPIRNLDSTRKALLIGDSYNYGSGGIQPYGWGYYLQQLSGATCDIVHQNGGGFTTPGASVATYPGKTFVQLVSELDGTKNYDFIIVQTGQNDANHGSVSAVNTAVPAFMTAIKAKYPNALVYIIPVFNDVYIDSAKNEILLAVAKKALENGAKTCFNSWFWLINSGVNSSYANHLTDDGYQLLAKYMLQFINGWAGDCNFQLNSQATLMGISELSSAFHNRGGAIETVMNSLMIFHGFYTVPNDIAASTKILQLRDRYTYRDTTNIYISSTSGAKYFTLDVHPDGGIYSRSAITATDTTDPYEVWIIVSVTPNTYVPT